MYLPKTVYYVAIRPGGQPLGFRQRGGKVFTNEQAAINHRASLLDKGVDAEVFETQVDWKTSNA